MKTYSGSCHCGGVRFEVTSDLAEPADCNCSICSRLGQIMISVKPSQFRRLSDVGAETDYQFGNKTMHHLFCATCGVHPFGLFEARGEKKVIVNVRCLEGVELGALQVRHYDGRSY